MGCVPSKPGPGAAQQAKLLIDQKIDYHIGRRNSSRSFDRPQAVKLLLLGAGESGKTTILKQMKLIHGKGFGHDERRLYAQVMWEQAFTQMMEIVRQARFLGIAMDCDDPNSVLHSHMLLLSKAGTNDDDSVKKDWDAIFEGIRSQRLFLEDAQLPMFRTDSQPQFADNSFTALSAERAEIANAISMLWTNDAGIKRCFARSNEYQLEDSAAYYFENVHKLADPDYLATNQDVIHGRIKTTGVTEHPFKIGQNDLTIVDVGGQQSERKKWLHCFDNVDCVLFVAALSEYDQVLYEDASMNRMEDSIKLFDTISNSPFLRHASIILFLNKCDLVEAKLKKSPIRKYFPHFSGPNELNAVKDFFRGLFLAQNKRGSSKDYYVHFTCATDTENMRFVMAAVTDMVMTAQLADIGII